EQVLEAEEEGHRADVHDPAAPPRGHRLAACTGGEEVALQVDREDVVPLLLGDLRPRPEWVDRRVVDEDVDAAELAHDPFGHRLDGRAIRDVPDDADTSTPRARD